MKTASMIFRQLFEPVSSTYTYLLGCEESGEAVLVDPVMPAWQRDLEAVNALGLKLVMTIDTHIHADHITSASMLRREAGSRIATPALDGLPCTDVAMHDAVPLQVGGLRIDPMHTPGHTDNHFALLAGDRVFTGDALLIDGCGRTDFQSGDSRALYHSVRGRLFGLPDDTLVYPAHDYNGRHVTSIADERRLNPRLQTTSVDEYVALMDSLRPPDASLSDVPEAPSLHPRAPRMRELLALKAALSSGSLLGEAPHTH